MVAKVSREELTGLLDYATERQAEIINAYLLSGTGAKAAKRLGISERNVREAIRRAKQAAASKGYIPSLELVRPAPEESNLTMTGASIYRDGIWHKYKVDKQQEQQGELLDAVKDALESYKPFKPVTPPKAIDKDLLAIYPLGDPHIGMYSWAAETGADFDCDIAEKNLKEALSYLVSKMPNAETAVILNLGDFFHTDNSANTTTKGTRVDVDTRFSRVLRIGIELMIDMVNIALTKHKKVIVRNNRGNHDKETSQVLSIVLMYAFKDNPRVEVYPPEKEFFCYTFGKNMIFSAHGDMLKPKQSAQYMAAAFPREWGNTEFRYAEFGHFHHEDRKEDGGVVVEIYNTLASSDAWHHNSGYLSNRNMKAKVLHKDNGEVERYTFSIARFGK